MYEIYVYHAIKGKVPLKTVSDLTEAKDFADKTYTDVIRPMRMARVIGFFAVVIEYKGKTWQYGSI